MASKALPPPEVLRQLLRHDPETGKLFWLPRPISFCTETPQRTAQHTKRLIDVTCAGREAFTSQNTTGYHQGSVFGRHYVAHKIIWALAYGAWPAGEIDHINGDKTDNRLANLREATRSQNQQNRKISTLNTSGFKGVSWSPRDGAWCARISRNGRRYYLGCYRSVEEAHAAYCKASAELHGVFGRVA